MNPRGAHVNFGDSYASLRRLSGPQVRVIRLLAHCEAESLTIGRRSYAPIGRHTRESGIEDDRAVNRRVATALERAGIVVTYETAGRLVVALTERGRHAARQCCKVLAP